LEQQYLTENHWLQVMFFSVFITSFFLYALYLFPMELIDRLYQCACHLGTWVEFGTGLREFQWPYWDETVRAPSKNDQIM
jgi:hypothetical protein